MIHLEIDGRDVEAHDGETILEAARRAELYIPTLCSHPDLPPVQDRCGVEAVWRTEHQVESDDPAATWDGCGLCMVELVDSGEAVRACNTPASAGLRVRLESELLTTLRRERLKAILTEHPHACLTCAQREGCSRTQCSSNVPEDERCCELLGSCELQRVAEFIGIPADTPRYRPRGEPSLGDEGLYDWNLELCIGCLRCVRACCDLRDVGAISFVMKDGRPLLGTIGGPTRRESHCRFCGACVEVCPTGSLMDHLSREGPGGARSGARPRGMDREAELVPCRAGCPGGVDIPRFVNAIAERDFGRSIAVIRESLPFSFAPSYVCFHPCEAACRRGIINQPISVCRLKRFAAENDMGEWRARLAEPRPTGKRVAVAGSGPAGLTAAFYLARKGHDVTVLEALAEPGGMLRVGIPEFRYPRSLLERDLEEVRSAGVEIRCNERVSGAEGLEVLGREYHAVFLATGAHRSRRIDIPGVDLEHVYWGVEFLRDRALGEIANAIFWGRRVAVIGGGNVAVDAARVARRLGAVSVTVISLEAFGDLPAYDIEVEEAGEEGVAFLDRWGPTEILAGEGRPSGVKLRRCTRVFDKQGRFAPAYDDRETREQPADAVILAIGQVPSSEAFASCGCTPAGTLKVDCESLETKIEGVFAGGDLVTGPRSVIEAIAMGKKAARLIDQRLGGDGVIEEKLAGEPTLPARLGLVEGFGGLERVATPKVEPCERAGSFALVDQGFDEDAAVAEAQRCLRCDLRLEIAPSVPAPRHEDLFELSDAVVGGLPEAEGVYRLLGEEREVLSIKGVLNLREALGEELSENKRARYFVYEIEPMYSKRESELIQQYLQEHGEMPGGGDDELDDLF